VEYFEACRLASCRLKPGVWRPVLDAPRGPRYSAPVFGWGQKHDASAPSRRESLDGVAVVGADVRLVRDAGRTLLVRTPPPRPPPRAFPASWFRLSLPEKRFALDDLGTEVFGLIDGRRSVRQIAEAFATRHGVNRREAQLSVAAFLRLLMQRGLVAVAVGGRGGGTKAGEAAVP
jgi:hypothetical protein